MRERLISVLRKLPQSLRERLFRTALILADDHLKFATGQIAMLGNIQNLRQAGFDPASVIDVGANIGLWSRQVSSIFPNARFAMFEAQSDLAPHLESACAGIGNQSTYQIALLGSKQADNVVLHTLGTGSSVFEEQTNLEKGRIVLPMVKLDDVLSGLDLQVPLFLKLDVQGYELEVLKGGSDTLGKAEVVLLEVSLLPYNKGAPLMPEVVAFMHERGFVPYDVCGIHRRTSDRALFQVDLMFARFQSDLRSDRPYSMFEAGAKDWQL